MKNNSTSQVSNARPWYLSLTAKWVEAEGFSDLKQILVDYMKRFPPPSHHVLVPEPSWHSTVFAILKINDKPIDVDSESKYATTLFEHLLTTTDLVDNIRQVFRPLQMTAQELKFFNDGTTVQFKSNEQLRGFRDSVRPLFESPVEALINDSVGGASNSPFLECLLRHKYKSCGAKFYGSVARSPSSQDKSSPRRTVRLPGTTLTFRRIHLLVSDDALTNPLCPGKNDFFIDPVDEEN